MTAYDEREYRRAMQRQRRASEDENARELRRKNDSRARRLARASLDDAQQQNIHQRGTASRTDAQRNLHEPRRVQIRQANTKGHRPHRRAQEIPWWDRVGALHTLEVPEPFGLQWNRRCKNCNIEGLINERLHDKCFVCGPKSSHYQPLLPSYPGEWNSFINDRKTADLSRKLNNLFTLIAIAVHDGDFMKFRPGISAVTLNGGRTYHRVRAIFVTSLLRLALRKCNFVTSSVHREHSLLGLPTITQ
ncbi:hypothetical protein K438DRAFT_1774916 [Mycena galopus ATCC 62051]|nr:hypothetical protein K438DRAFT_1774916 [Mycena galopus ATCC 62051]